MREIEQIVDFSKGIITSVDAIDIPAESCVLATNIEPNEGYIVPVKEPSTHTSIANRGLAIKDYGFVVKTSTTKSIICQDDTKIKYGTYSPLTPFNSDLTDLGTYDSTDIITYNREARIAGGSTTQKIFKHTDFYTFGRRGMEYTINKFDTNYANNYNNLLMLRGEPTIAFTLLIPLFLVTSNTLTRVQLSGSAENQEILDALESYRLASHTLTLAMFNDDALSPKQETKQITSIDSSNLIIEWSGDLTTLTGSNEVKTCFLYFGVNYDANPVVIKKEVGTPTIFTVIPCPGSAASYTDVGNGVYFRPVGAYETNSSIIQRTRRINAKIEITPKEYLYEDLPVTTYDSTKIQLATSMTGSGGYFKSGTRYWYKFSLTYDGGQESQLCSTTQADYEDPSAETTSINVVVQFKDINLSRRITGINLYRSEVKDGVSSLYRLIDSADLTLQSTGLSDSSWFDKTNNWVQYSFTDNGEWSASYESITGTAEDIATITPKYTYGIIAYNRLFTIGNEITDEPEINKTLLMSEPFKFDVFNWDENQIMLPSTPKGLGYFRDKIYVFGDNVIWKCNPDMLAIEDTYYGYQLLHNRSMLTTDFGLIFAATTGVYVLDGTNVTELSYPIRDTNGVNSGIRSSCKSWNYSTTNNRVFIYYMHSKNQILFFDTYTETGWVYHIRYKSWWHLDFGASSTLANSCLITDELSNIFWSTGTAIKKMFAGTNYAGATWISKLFTNSTSSQKKRLYFVKHESENYSSNLTAYVDNAGSSTLTSDSAGNVTDTTYKSLQLKWANVASSTKRTIKDIEMVFRRMKGVR